MLLEEKQTPLEAEQSLTAQIIGNSDPRILRVMVFGSYASGRHTPLSDKDFLIITDSIDPQIL